MFWRCFQKNIDVDVFDDVLQNAKHRANDVNRPPLGGRGTHTDINTTFHHSPGYLEGSKLGVVDLIGQFESLETI